MLTGDRRSGAEPARVPTSPLVIITGPSGAGKGTLLRALEDRGYFCVDNLPVGLLTKFAELAFKAEGEVRRAALVVDVREGKALNEFPLTFADLKSSSNLDVSLYFLEASDEVLIRRFSETRRPHPMDASLPIREAILLERARLAPIRALADEVIDTSTFSIHQLRSHASRLFAEHEGAPLLVTLQSFGYKHGIPVDADMIFDVRFLPNPFFVPELKALTGRDDAVVEYLRSQEVAMAFLEKLRSMIEFLLPEFEREGKAYLTIAIGCTGGRHRSVMIAEGLREYLSAKEEYRLKVVHRDVDK
jgi:UPF0042 nucleotide-binding protein